MEVVESEQVQNLNREETAMKQDSAASISADDMQVGSSGTVISNEASTTLDPAINMLQPKSS